MTGWGREGKVGFVTGGASGIGLAIVETLTRQGATVGAYDLNPATAPESAALALEVDVSDEPAVVAAFAVVDERFEQLDFLVNDAGIDIETGPSLEWLTDPLNGTIEVDMKGVYHCMRHAISQMRQRESGSIVNLGSVAALVGTATRPVDAASKDAVVGLTRTAGIEFGRENIRTNIVCPGGTRTPFRETVMTDNPELREQVASGNPMRLLEEPSEIADAVAWLVSPRSSFVSGAVLPVDGGFSAA